MNARLFLLERWLPGWLRRRMFRKLVRLTARAFASTPPRLRRPRQDEAIAAFAAFTRAEVERVLASRDAAAANAVRQRLRDGALEMGSAIRRQLRLASRADEFRALRLLYAGIGIDLHGDERDGQIVIAHCAFSAAYTRDVCAFISALDAGIVAGVTAGDELSFSQRITEGAPCCRARVTGSALP